MILSVGVTDPKNQRSSGCWARRDVRHGTRALLSREGSFNLPAFRTGSSLQTIGSDRRSEQRRVMLRCVFVQNGRRYYTFCHLIYIYIYTYIHMYSTILELGAQNLWALIGSMYGPSWKGFREWSPISPSQGFMVEGLRIQPVPVRAPQGFKGWGFRGRPGVLLSPLWSEWAWAPFPWSEPLSPNLKLPI